jgi:2-polyprenyl-3-methyl-5-hydroxy-6-metoxy-1,4-benzoquinol methylase
MREDGNVAQTHEIQDAIVWEIVPCDLCGSTEAEKLLDGIDWEFGLNEQLRLVQCNQCRLIYLNPRPTLSSIPLIYPPSYGFFCRSKGLRHLLKSAYYKMTAPYPYLDGVKPGKILDVGCATGDTNYPYGENGSLRQLKRKGWNVSGLEPDENAAKIARSYGIYIHSGRLSDIGTLGERFDVVRFNHVLEHSASPMKDLSIAAALLNKNGRLIVSGPNIASAAFFLFQKYWSGLDLPRHYYNFTPNTLRKYCENTKLRVHAEYYDGQTSDFVHSMRHFLQSIEVSGKNSVCQGEESIRDNAIARLYSQFSRVCLYVAVRTLVRYFNCRGLSDNYTVVAVPDRPPNYVPVDMRVIG